MSSIPKKAVVIGASAGGIDALSLLLPKIPANSQVPVFIVQHISPDSKSFIVDILDNHCNVIVKEALHTEIIVPGVVYFAPPDYHLLIEDDYTLSLSADEKVNFSRPSIDLLFETAADVYGMNLTGIILTGANKDGSAGLKKIKEAGGKTIVQNPEQSFMSEMPEAAIKACQPDKILSLAQIAEVLQYINKI